MTETRSSGILLAILGLGSCLVLACSDAGGAACTGTPSFCFAGVGNRCSDAGSAVEVCVAGQWRCPSSGLIPMSQCKCSGAQPPGCSCGSSGWDCPTPDAGAAGGAGGASVGTGGGGSGGTGGGAAGQGGGGGALACGSVTTLQACDARGDCHAVLRTPAHAAARRSAAARASRAARTATGPAARRARCSARWRSPTASNRTSSATSTAATKAVCAIPSAC